MSIATKLFHHLSLIILLLILWPTSHHQKLRSNLARPIWRISRVRQIINKVALYLTKFGTRATLFAIKRKSFAKALSAVCPGAVVPERSAISRVPIKHIYNAVYQQACLEFSDRCESCQRRSFHPNSHNKRRSHGWNGRTGSKVNGDASFCQNDKFVRRYLMQVAA